MSRIYFSSDYHLNHYNIIEGNSSWGIRSFHSVKHMNSTIIHRCNSMVHKNDLLYHLGDFQFKGGNQLRIELEKQFNGKIIHIIGNHDHNNGIKGINKAEITIGGYNVLLQHIPPYDIFDIPSHIDFVLCGHIHSSWKYRVIDNIPIINVGVDVWDFYPVSIKTIIKLYAEILKKI